MLEVTLQKSIANHVSDEMHLVQSPRGPSLFNDTEEKNHVPEPHMKDVKSLQQHLDNPKPEAGSMFRHNSVQTKALHDDSQGNTWLLKPYHERAYNNVHPSSGWAEMTSQALYHAGGIGHLHQTVGVVHDKNRLSDVTQPLIAIKIASDHIEATSSVRNKKAGQNAKTGEGVHKIALMDYLTDNRDRHYQNLMIGPNSEPLAIDNAGALMYNAGGFRNRHIKGISAYHIGPLDEISLPNEAHQKSTMEWWKQNGVNIRNAMAQRLKLVRNSALKQHIWNNFNARAEKLDQASKHHGAFWNTGHPVIDTPGLPSTMVEEDQK